MFYLGTDLKFNGVLLKRIRSITDNLSCGYFCLTYHSYDVRFKESVIELDTYFNAEGDAGGSSDSKTPNSSMEMSLSFPVFPTSETDSKYMSTITNRSRINDWK